MKKILKQNKRRIRALALRKKGLTYQAIADKIGVSRERVRQYIKGDPQYSAELRHKKYMNSLKKKLKEIK